MAAHCGLGSRNSSRVFRGAVVRMCLYTHAQILHKIFCIRDGLGPTMQCFASEPSMLTGTRRSTCTVSGGHQQSIP